MFPLKSTPSVIPPIFMHILRGWEEVSGEETLYILWSPINLREKQGSFLTYVFYLFIYFIFVIIFYSINWGERPGPFLTYVFIYLFFIIIFYTSPENMFIDF